MENNTHKKKLLYTAVRVDKSTGLYIQLRQERHDMYREFLYVKFLETIRQH
jgi:hypothetical protein